jgi:pimeloyl-ACP methyl ester carboxylesterase
MKEHFIDNNGVSIHALELNDSCDGIPVVIVPGMGNAAENIAENIGALLTRRTIILSLRGRGMSDSPQTGWGLEDQASDIATVVEHFGFSRIALFGHSTGASIAARSIPMISADIVAFIIGDFPPFYPAYSESWAARVKKMELPITDIALTGIVRDARQTDVSDYLHSVDNLFAITGDLDKSLLKANDIARLEQMFPLIKIERLNRCSHEFLSDDPVRSIAAIEKFIAFAD